MSRSKSSFEKSSLHFIGESIAFMSGGDEKRPQCSLLTTLRFGWSKPFVLTFVSGKGYGIHFGLRIIPPLAPEVHTEIKYHYFVILDGNHMVA